MSTATASMKECIENCQECQTTCADMLTCHCLSEGVDHVEQTHVRLFLSDIRRIYADSVRMTMVPTGHETPKLSYFGKELGSFGPRTTQS